MGKMNEDEVSTQEGTMNMHQSVYEIRLNPTSIFRQGGMPKGADTSWVDRVRIIYLDFSTLVQYLCLDF